MQLVVALFAFAYFVVGPIVTAVGMLAATVLTVVSGVVAVTSQIVAGVAGGRLTGHPRLPMRAGGWLLIVAGTAVAGASGLFAVLLALALMVVDGLPYPESIPGDGVWPATP